MSNERRPKIVVIAGPTASGKSGFAVSLAHSLSGEIVNADSMQVYQGMDIGTAKPTPEEQGGIPHHLLDVVRPDEPFNAAIYRSKALSAVTDICSRGKPCLVVGGTGLYIRALVGGLMKAPPSDPTVREALCRECDLSGPARLHERLTGLDPQCAAAIHPNDRIRIIRALEIIHISDRLSSDIMKGHGFREPSLDALKICLNVDRETLYHRIDKRTVKMADMGLLEETRHLLEKGYSPDLRPMKAIGYRHMVRHLKGEWSFEEAIHTLKRDTRRYAKRQFTWFRAEPEVIWIDPDGIDVVLEQIELFLSENA
ncbi:MAG: tRNA (adenosine(37)-N6)-dimethylallyltransferase MiaA [Deltaproteobacteria bacterium]|nr:tRNA (adenosine(37)-N6)-dimethylallyltransferase MiaA [Deltaproteobacteria bacterium]